MEMEETKLVLPRVVFACPPSATHLKKVFTGNIHIDSALVSFYYLDKCSDKAIESAFRTLRDNCGCRYIYVDSGIFSLKMKQGAVKGGRSFAITKEGRQERVDRGLLLLHDHVDFAKRYIKWLRRYDGLYDFFFDLDVEEFLGLDVAERFWASLMDNIPSPEKVIRIWHAAFRGYEDWREWCESGEHTYLSLEGNISHSRSPDFYRRFINVAREHRVLTHILALTDERLFRTLPFTTGDSSTWMSGARYGRLITKYGSISFGRSIKSGNHIDTISDELFGMVDGYLREGVGVGLDDLRGNENWPKRNMANILYYNELNKISASDVQKIGFLDGLR